MSVEIRIDEDVRRGAAAVFERLGLSEEEAVTLFYKRTIAAGRLPFGAAGTEGKEKVRRKRMNERFAEWDAR